MITPASTHDVETRSRVLFVGREGSSTQIAASLLRHATEDRVSVNTAATEPTEPGGRSDEMLVAMGLNPSDEPQLSTRALYTADRVVVLDADLDVARLSGPSYEEWDLEHDDLVVRVQALSDALTADPAPNPPRLLGRLRTLLMSIRGH